MKFPVVEVLNQKNVGILKFDEKSSVYKLTINDPFKRSFVVISNKDPLDKSDYFIFKPRELNETVGTGKIEYINRRPQIIFEVLNNCYQVTLTKGNL